MKGTHETGAVGNARNSYRLSLTLLALRGSSEIALSLLGQSINMIKDTNLLTFSPKVFTL